MLHTLVPFGLLDSEDFLRALLILGLHHATKLALAHLVDLDEVVLESACLLLAERYGASGTEEPSLRERVARSWLLEQCRDSFLRGGIRRVSVTSLMQTESIGRCREMSGYGRRRW